MVRIYEFANAMGRFTGLHSVIYSTRDMINVSLQASYDSPCVAWFDFEIMDGHAKLCHAECAPGLRLEAYRFIYRGQFSYTGSGNAVPSAMVLNATPDHDIMPTDEVHNC